MKKRSFANIDGDTGEGEVLQGSLGWGERGVWRFFSLRAAGGKVRGEGSRMGRSQTGPPLPFSSFPQLPRRDEVIFSFWISDKDY